MSKLLFHPKVSLQIKYTLRRLPHALLLTGPQGSGKHTLSHYLISNILALSIENIEQYPYLLVISPSDDSISIEEIRQMQQFLKLKVPSGQSGIQRIILIEDAERMRTEAQNALLKSLEEPPTDTMFILTSSHAENLLTTIRSRTVELPVLPVGVEQATGYFFNQGNAQTAIQSAYALSQGQMGLMSALLNEEVHPLREQVKQAKDILRMPVSKRLTLTDGLVKDKQQITLLLNAFLRITHAALTQASRQGQENAIQHWHLTQSSTAHALQIMRHNPNTKLLLDDLFMQI